MPISILFLCLARNCARTLPGFFAYLDQLESAGFRCAAIIGENGSSDETRTVIEKAANPKIALLDTTFMAECSNRLVRMAMGRQALLDAAKSRGISEGYICVVDLDNVIVNPPSPPAVRAAVKQLRGDSTIFAVGATSFPVYYDLLSLRVEGYEFLSNLDEQIRGAKKRLCSYYRFHQEHIYSNQKLMTRGTPVLCASSFNGFCLYGVSDYCLGSYRAGDEANVCEHVSFNLSIGRATGKRMQISPGLVIQAPADHIPVGFFRFWSDRIIERLPRFRVKSGMVSS
jgi:hypothetical protein